MIEISNTPIEERGARICMATSRRFNKQVYRSGLYEAEDVLVQTGDVDLIHLEPDAGFQWRDWLHKRLVYRDWTHKLVHLNPGLQRVQLTRDYDLFVAICQHHDDLAYINAIDGWKDRCRTSVCWIDEIWAAQLPKKYRHWLSALSKFDHVFVGSEADSAGPLSEAIGQSCSWVPLGVDTLRFSPFPEPAERVVDVFSMGRALEPIHQSLQRMSANKEIFYLHDTFSAAIAKVYDYRQHRDMLANLAQRSLYFVVAPSKFDDPDQTQGQIAFGPRYYEGSSAGAVLIGQAPDLTAFRQMFDWPEAVVEISPDGSDVADILRSLETDPQRLREISRRNVVESLLRHDWLYRWQHIFQIAGIKLSPGMAARQAQLQELAASISKSGRSVHCPN